MKCATMKLLLPALLLVLVSAGGVNAAETALLKAKIVDVAGKPVSGVKLFMYKTLNVRMPADFISPPSDNGGRVQAALPAGTYWAVARLKKDDTFGPLMPGDRHSGEPLEIEVSVGKELLVDFVVADIQEISQKKRSSTTDVIKVNGRVLNKDGLPVANVYVFAHRTKEVLSLPDFISAWTDENGTYSLYLPAGAKYFLGSATQFPPVAKLSVVRELEAERGKLDIAMDLELTVK